MPYFRVRFVREMELDIDASCIDEANEIAERTVDDIDESWDPDGWIVDSVIPVGFPINLQGIGKDWTMVHISDNVLVDERDDLHLLNDKKDR